MVPFRVIVRRDPSAPAPSSLVFPLVKSQNAAHAAACGLSLAGGGCAHVIDVQALAPRPGRPVHTSFVQCSQGVYGFCYTACVTPEKEVSR